MGWRSHARLDVWHRPHARLSPANDSDISSSNKKGRMVACPSHLGFPIPLFVPERKPRSLRKKHLAEEMVISTTTPSDNSRKVPSDQTLSIIHGGGDEVTYEYTPFNVSFLRTYKSGRVERLLGTVRLPPSNPDPDPITGVTSKDVAITPDSSVSARLYLPPNLTADQKLPILVYFHGGGFCAESPYSPYYHLYINSLVSQSNVLGVSVDYRLAPEHPLPATYHDSLKALEWVKCQSDGWIKDHGDLSRLFLGGDSAGANICHWLAMRHTHSRSTVQIEGMILVHCYFWEKEPIGNETRDLEHRKKAKREWLFLYPESKDGLDDPCLNPTAESSPSLEGLGCRRLLVCTAENDFFKDRALLYVEKVIGSGWKGKVEEVLVTEGEGHVFHLLKPECEKAVEMMQRVIGFFNAASNRVQKEDDDP